MSSNRRKFVRRAIGYAATIFAPDGSWSRKCRVIDISQTGAKLGFEEASDLPPNFVLALSERGGPTRHCRLMWAANEQAGVEFERPKKDEAA